MCSNPLLKIVCNKSIFMSVRIIFAKKKKDTAQLFEEMRHKKKRLIFFEEQEEMDLA